MPQTPRILCSDLTKPRRWFVVTRYQIKDGIDPCNGERIQYVKAQTKHDVTEQMDAILAADRKARRKSQRERD